MSLPDYMPVPQRRRIQAFIDSFQSPHKPVIYSRRFSPHQCFYLITLFPCKAWMNIVNDKLKIHVNNKIFTLNSMKEGCVIYKLPNNEMIMEPLPKTPRQRLPKRMTWIKLVATLERRQLINCRTIPQYADKEIQGIDYAHQLLLPFPFQIDELSGQGCNAFKEHLLYLYNLPTELGFPYTCRCEECLDPTTDASSLVADYLMARYHIGAQSVPQSCFIQTEINSWYKMSLNGKTIKEMADQIYTNKYIKQDQRDVFLACDDDNLYYDFI